MAYDMLLKSHIPSESMKTIWKEKSKIEFPLVNIFVAKGMAIFSIF